MTDLRPPKGIKKGDLAQPQRLRFGQRVRYAQAPRSTPRPTTVQTELQNRESAARVAEVMLREEELSAFCASCLKTLNRAYVFRRWGAVISSERGQDRL